MKRREEAAAKELKRARYEVERLGLEVERLRVEKPRSQEYRQADTLLLRAKREKTAMAQQLAAVRQLLPEMERLGLEEQGSRMRRVELVQGRLIDGAPVSTPSIQLGQPVPGLLKEYDEATEANERYMEARQLRDKVMLEACVIEEEAQKGLQRQSESLERTSSMALELSAASKVQHQKALAAQQRYEKALDKLDGEMSTELAEIEAKLKATPPPGLEESLGLSSPERSGAERSGDEGFLSLSPSFYLSLSPGATDEDQTPDVSQEPSPGRRTVSLPVSVISERQKAAEKSAALAEARRLAEEQLEPRVSRSAARGRPRAPKVQRTRPVALRSTLKPQSAPQPKIVATKPKKRRKRRPKLAVGDTPHLARPQTRGPSAGRLRVQDLTPGGGLAEDTKAGGERSCAHGDRLARHCSGYFVADEPLNEIHEETRPFEAPCLPALSKEEADYEVLNGMLKAQYAHDNDIEGFGRLRSTSPSLLARQLRDASMMHKRQTESVERCTVRPRTAGAAGFARKDQRTPSTPVGPNGNPLRLNRVIAPLLGRHPDAKSPNAPAPTICGAERKLVTSAYPLEYGSSAGPGSCRTDSDFECGGRGVQFGTRHTHQQSGDPNTDGDTIDEGLPARPVSTTSNHRPKNKQAARKLSKRRMASQARLGMLGRDQATIYARDHRLKLALRPSTSTEHILSRTGKSASPDSWFRSLSPPTFPDPVAVAPEPVEEEPPRVEGHFSSKLRRSEEDNPVLHESLESIEMDM
eukprot:TRINITY_DN18117_c0_g1_i1.p1 TRINITY_DN18117_c0_g1~~TRINITY_DN18117_c0_g1_i1.p1  ORF type:complete len:753 (-),score=129.37 TRINITY_DN18117_c0_g1_i1:226-2484(-)